MMYPERAFESFLLLSLSFSCLKASLGAPCPFSLNAPCDQNDSNVFPNDDAHKNLIPKSGLRRRVISLSDNPDTKEKFMSIINKPSKDRFLQEGCLSVETYDEIEADISLLKDSFLEDESRSHFLGGIVRLAAHDFMDYDKDNAPHMGPDGCIDMMHSANAGLPDDIWCDQCELTILYEAHYSHISKADFWIAAANAVIHLTSPNNELDLKSTFVWGRTDAESCSESADRLPGASSCSEVENVFLTRLGLTWTDAVALIGAHTLGRGDSNFSGHHGIWVDTDAESMIFDKRYYEEIFRRAWIPRNEGTDIQDWTWGAPNGNSPRFMLNTDMCLFYDIDSDSNFPCCSRTDLVTPNGGNSCGDLSTNECPTYDDLSTRKEAADAVDEFARGGGMGLNNDNNEPFFTAFAAAWAKATTNGWSGLQELAITCGPTPAPTPAPTTSPTTLMPTGKPTGNPTFSPTLSPTTSPVVILSPTTLSPVSDCVDVESFTDNNGRIRTCSWVLTPDRNRCRPFAHLCPVTCGECECLLTGRVCTVNEDCCSNECGPDGECQCLRRNASCTSDKQCCSGVCETDGTCAGSGTLIP